MTEDTTPQIYVACLAAYNNGKLHGTWIDCNQEAEVIWEEINEMLIESPEPEAEEWAIHDSENWQGIQISEYENIKRLAELAQMLAEHGKAFAVYYRYYGNDTNVEDFTEHYLGEYKSEEDFVYEQWQEDGRLDQLKKLGVTDSYIDWKAIATDWFIDSYYSVNVSFERVYVFSRQ
jgi:antirestriction protein